MLEGKIPIVFRVALMGLTNQPLVVDPIGCFAMFAHFYDMGDPNFLFLILLVDFYFTISALVNITYSVGLMSCHIGVFLFVLLLLDL